MSVLLDVQGLEKRFPIYGGILYRKIADVHALNGVSFTLKKGGTLGVVGESGCGKSTLGKTLLRLHEPSAGKAFFKGKDIFGLQPGDLKEMRQHIQMIFQDPYSCLNPRMPVGKILEEPLIIHGVQSKAVRMKEVYRLLDVVGMRKAVADRFPHEFSGGQRQRIGIARSLALKPELIIADEPVSALDVSIQSQVLNLMCDLQNEFNITYIFISHDLSVVEYISDVIAVMYLGHIVEMASKEEMFRNPRHPYTQSLLSAIPIPDPDVKRDRVILPGDVPSPIFMPAGCPFHPRCPIATDECSQKMPDLETVGVVNDQEHVVACINKQQTQSKLNGRGNERNL